MGAGGYRRAIGHSASIVFSMKGKVFPDAIRTATAAMRVRYTALRNGLVLPGRWMRTLASAPSQCFFHFLWAP